MWLTNAFGSSFLWLSRLFFRVYSVAPKQTAAIVFFSFFSNIFLTLTFFLPLKIIILVGSDGMPSYFVEIFGTVEKGLLVYWLVVGTVASYIINLAFNYITDIFVVKGAKKVLKGSDKISYFSNYIAETNSFYKKICQAQSSIVFILLGCLLTIFASSIWFADLSLFLMGSFILISLSGVINKAFILWIKDKSHVTLSVLSTTAFLVFFGSIINSFTKNIEGVNLLLAIISMLVIRQVLQKSVSVILDSIYLVIKKEKVDHVFHFDSPVSVIVNKKDIWSLLSAKDRNETLGTYFEQIFYKKIFVSRSQFCQLGQRNVIGFKLSLDEKQLLDNKSRLFIKIFDARSDYLASHEADLYGNKISKLLPTLEFIAGSNQLSNPVLVFNDFEGTNLSGRAAREKGLDILMDCWGVTPDQTIVQKYYRSYQPLLSRIDQNLVSQLEGACINEDHDFLVKSFVKNFNGIVSIVASLPVFIYNPYLNMRTIVESYDSKIIVTDWSRWAIEPIGCGWGAVDRAGLAQLHDRFTKKMKSVEAFSGVQVEYVKMVALIYNLERCCRGKNYHDAFNVLSEIAILTSFLQSASLSPSA